MDGVVERGSLTVAERLGQYCALVFDFAITRDLCDYNPAQGRVKALPKHSRKNHPHMKEEELPAFLERLRQHDNVQMKLAHTLMLHTVVRPGELVKARWQDINLDARQWVIPADFMKIKREHIVPLSRQAIEAIEELRPITGNGVYLFPGRNPSKPVTTEALLKHAKLLSDGKSVSHGYRHTFSTIMNERNFNGDHIEMQLAHVNKDKVRGAYNKALYLEQRAEMMQKWADLLEEKTKQ